MNIHIKTRSNTEEYDEARLAKIIALIRKYDCEKWVYFCSGNDNLLRLCKKLAPDIARCVGAGNDPWGLVERAVEMGCEKIQLFKPKFDQDIITRAHEKGLVVNVFWSDDVQEAKTFLEMGIDTILTNDYNLVSQAIKR